MTKKYWLKLATLLLMPLSVGLTVSCFNFGVQSSPSGSNGGGSTIKPIDNPSNNDDTTMRLYDEMPEWAPKTERNGLKKQWEYIKDIPNVVKRLNPSDSNFPELLNPKIVKEYQKAMKKANRAYITDDWNDRSSFTYILEELWGAETSTFRGDVKSVMFDSLRLYDDSKIGFLEMLALEFGTYYYGHLHQLEVMGYYMKYKSLLYSLTDKNKTILEQAQEHPQLKGVIKRLGEQINEFLNPKIHASMNAKPFADEWKNSNLKEFYGEMLDFVNEELAPLAIKLGVNTQSSFKALANQDIIEQHVLKSFSGKKLKMTYTEDEINSFWNRFKLLAKNRYGWKGSDL